MDFSTFLTENTPASPVATAKGNATVSLTPAKIREQLAQDFLIDDRILGQLSAALNSGSHVILSGPPGTGKTTLASAVCKAAQGVDPMLSTATADWTTFDTVGGYMPDLSKSTHNTNALTFEPGIILQSMLNRRWIIVDEINRAPIDKAIGQLFTVLSGGSVLLSFRNTLSNSRIEIKMSNELSTADNYTCPPDWRMIATMNEYDKDSLFDMSYAFMRRFAIIRLGLPVNFKAGIALWAAAAGLQDVITANLQELVDALDGQREIGPAIFRSMIDYIQAKNVFDPDVKSSYAEALSIFVVPQLQGVEDEAAQTLYNTAGSCLDQVQRQIIRDSIYGATGYKPHD
jgi:MoxR-like ATPase